MDECVGITLTEGGSSEIVFFLPRFVVPGTFGPIMEEVYFIISVSGGNRTPPRILAESLSRDGGGTGCDAGVVTGDPL